MKVVLDAFVGSHLFVYVFLVQSVDIPLLCRLVDSVASMLLHLWCVACIFIAIYNIDSNGKFTLMVVQ